jgi:MraZ protein
MFLGTHAPRLDEKGRLFLPAKYRDELSGGVVITKGQERCLYVFPQDEFQRITEALRTAPVTAKAVRDYSRVFFASASDEIPDKQGRITVPAALRSYAGLDRDCVVIGANTRLEICTRRHGKPTWPPRRTRSPKPPRRCCQEFSDRSPRTGRPPAVRRVWKPHPYHQAGATSPAPGGYRPWGDSRGTTWRGFPEPAGPKTGSRSEKQQYRRRAASGAVPRGRQATARLTRP